MDRIVFLLAVQDVDAKKLGLRSSEFGLLMYLKLQGHEGKPAPTREELLARLPIQERTLDGALAVLKKRGLIERAIVYRVTEEGRKLGE